MEITYTIKIKGKHNPPEFKKGMGKGVVSIQVVEHKDMTEEDLEDPSFIRHVYCDYVQELLDDWFEVVVTVKDKKEKKKK